MPKVEWHSVALAPVVLIHGPERLLADRAAARLRALALEADPATEITRTSALEYSGGSLASLTSPSLFQEVRLLEIDDAHVSDEKFVADVDAYLGDPADGVVLVLIHRGGNRGKKLLQRIAAHQIPTVPAEQIKRLSDKQTFAAAEFTRAGRRVQGPAVQALVDGVGGDLTELAAVISQLIADTAPDAAEQPRPITLEDVHGLLGGRVDAKAYSVADAAVAGRATEALTLLRQCLRSGVDPVPLVAALAAKMRGIAKATALGRGVTASQLGMPDWMLRNVTRDARAWSDHGVRTAIEVIARADADVKGASRDPEYAVQRAVLAICDARALR